MTEKEVSHEEALEALGKKPEKKKKEKYKSKDGFVEVEVLRGFTEISSMYSVVNAHGGIILGGYVRYMCSPSVQKRLAPSSDLDIYSPDKEIFHTLKESFTNFGVEMKAENDLAVTYKPFKRDHDFFPCPKIQLVKPMEEGVVVTQGDMRSILENFDFTVVRIGLLSPTRALADADFLHDEEKHVMRIKNIHCPISTFYRIMKYNRKGYWPATSQIVKVFLDWDGRDEEYKMKIIEFLQKEDPTKDEIDKMEKMMRAFD
jgi:hypothetical protein